MSSTSYSQDRLPSIAVTPPGSETEKAKRIPPIRQTDKKFRSDNKDLEGTVELQYQISLLQKMIQRQGSIGRLEKSYLDLGVAFTSPLPPKGICEQIPMNVPCFRAYPEIYGLDWTEESVEVIASIDQESVVESLQNSQQVQVIKAVEPQEEIPEIIVSDYRWIDVTCLAGECRALLVNEFSPGERYTVRSGTKLDDGSKVTDISARGVHVLKSGEKLNLLPARAPGQGGPSSIRLSSFSESKGTPSAPREPINNEPVQQSTSAPSQAKAVPAPSVVEEPIEDLGPPLGPTGLF